MSPPSWSPADDLGRCHLDLANEALLELRALIRRNAVYLTSIFAGAFAFEIAFDTSTNKLWDTWNRGRQWKDIKFQYVNKAEEEDDDE
ncbi:ubiquinol-cytochrome C reductase [Aspergillus karnatakaensis]|uniref:cytochrome b-c1 complex subunit 9 n=1 Tax=Aspergillus karnatakaensis TaxID=1810916 RepID=UPI003CCCD7C0